MRSDDLDLKKYDSDKCQYLKRYDPVFEPYLDKKVVLLELGVLKGGSLLMWNDYFKKGSIVGIDINLPMDSQLSDRISVFEGNQTDIGFLADVASRTAPYGYDIIIDDASHMGELTKKSFWYLFDNHLKPGGLYVIEDWGTGYWEDWPDGSALDLDLYSQNQGATISKTPLPCHSYGMVGFIKQLVDEQGASDITKFQSNKVKRSSKFENMIITPFLVFVKKSS
jgi:SAM-dependent methyltransferase